MHVSVNNGNIDKCWYLMSDYRPRFSGAMKIHASVITGTGLKKNTRVSANMPKKLGSVGWKIFLFFV